MVDFGPLIRDFPTLRAQATKLQTPNAKDHHRIKLAMVGFSRGSDIAHWDYQHYEFIQNRLNTDLSAGSFSVAWIDFACIAMGLLLGLVDSGNIETDADFRIADAQLPGFMWMHTAEIDRFDVTINGT